MFEGKLLGKIEIHGEAFSITCAKLNNRRVVVERKGLGSKTISIMAADLSSIFENYKEDLEQVANMAITEIYKWENPDNVKGELFIGESEIIKCSETEGIIVNSFW